MIVEAITGSAALLGACGGVYSIVVSRGAREAATRRTASEAAQVEDRTWIDRLEALDNQFVKQEAQFNKLQQLSDERFNKLIEIEMAITEHVQWDYQVVRESRRHGLHIPDPPSLQYIRRLAAEAKDREREGKQVLNGHS